MDIGEPDSNILDIPLTQIFAYEALLMTRSHVLEQLIGAKERFVTELSVTNKLSTQNFSF